MAADGTPPILVTPERSFATRESVGLWARAGHAVRGGRQEAGTWPTAGAAASPRSGCIEADVVARPGQLPTRHQLGRRRAPCAQPMRRPVRVERRLVCARRQDRLPAGNDRPATALCPAPTLPTNSRQTIGASALRLARPLDRCRQRLASDALQSSARAPEFVGVLASRASGELGSVCRVAATSHRQLLRSRIVRQRHRAESPAKSQRQIAAARAAHLNRVGTRIASAAGQSAALGADVRANE